MGYLANFMVYTFAMVGVIAVALLVFKNATSGNCGGRKSKYLKIHDSLSLGARKTLYIVSAGNEKFLIAGDVDKTSLISKLESNEEISFKETIKSVETSSQDIPFSKISKQDFMDRKGIGIKSSILHPDEKQSVMRSLVERMR